MSGPYARKPDGLFRAPLLAGLLLALVSLGAQPVYASLSGIVGRSTSGCASCHGAALSGTAIVNFTGSSTIVEGISSSAYSVTVSRSSAGQGTGFNASVSNTVSSTATLTAGANNQNIGGELTHNAATGDAGSAAVAFPFTLVPGEVTSNQVITLNVCGQRVNRSGTVSGDGPYFCNTRTVTVQNNLPPVANAGIDQTVLDGAAVTLNSTNLASTDTEGTTLARSWSRTGGSCAATPTLSSSTASQPTFTAPALASGSCTLIYTLTVTDNSGAGKSGSDTATITVNNPPTSVPAVTSDQSASSPFYDSTTACVNTATTITLNGTGSTDTGGSIASYAWSKTAGAAVTLLNAGTSTATFAAPAQAAGTSSSYTFQLVVTDNLGATSTNTVTFTVRDRQVGGSNPVAAAGADQNANENMLVNLADNGSSDPDGCAVSYSWTQIGTPTVTLNNAATATPSFTTPSVAANTTLTFRLTATDFSGLTGTDDVLVQVNNAPTAVASASSNETPAAVSPFYDTTTACGSTPSTISLSSSGSTDVGGSISTFAWSQIAGTGVTLSTANAATSTFTAPAQAFGTTSAPAYQFRLTVTDALGASHTNDVTFSIRDRAVGSASPVANAGTDVNANEGAPVDLTSAASTDPDGCSGLGYSWAQIGVPAVSLTGASTATPSFAAPTVAANTTLTFRVTVTDATGLSATDDVLVNVNNGPTADAGSPQTVTEGSTVNLTAAGSTDVGGGAITYAWVQLPSATVTLNSANTVAPNFVAPAQGFNASTALTFQVTATDSGSLTSTSSVVVTVNDIAVGGNDPVANAGTAQTVNEGTGATLSGGATDVDGGVLGFAWTQISGTAVTLNTPNSASTSFTPPLIDAPTTGSSTLVFQLTVTDPTLRSDTSNVTITVNNGPSADAGADQTVTEGSGVVLNGSASFDPPGPGGVTYLWQQTAGPAATLSSGSAASPSFTAPAVGAVGGSDTLTFQLTVTDAGGLQSIDTVLVQIDDIAVGNNAPTANAGADQAANENAAVALAGSGTDPEGASVTYSWIQTLGTAVTLSGANTATPSFAAPDISQTDVASVTLTFQVTVTDDVGRSDTDTVVITVNNGPNADAGSDQQVLEGASVSLSAVASNDPGLGALTYSWTQIAGPTVTLVNANSATPGFIAPTQAFDSSTQYTFQVAVTDAGGLTATATVVITVDDIAIGNAPPVADAGADASVNENATAGLNGSTSSDPEGSALTYIWTQTSGTSVVLLNSTTATPSFNAPDIAETNVGSSTLVFQLTVTDNVGRSTSDSVTMTVNNGPNANPGSAQSVFEGATVNLSAAASDDNGGALGFAWTQQSGATVTLTGGNTATPSFTAPAQLFNASSDLTFRVTVTDGGGLSQSSTVTITVKDAAVGNADPTASAGADQRVNEGATVNLAGSGSDPESGALSFNWTQTAGTAVSLTGATGASPSFTAPPVSGSTASVTLTFQFTVTDNVGRTQTDSVDVVVNNAPTANAGLDQTVLDNRLVTLTGAGSSDAGGGAITYQWLQTAGPTSLTLSNATSATPTFTGPDVSTSDTYTFQLTVTDTDGATAIDTVDVIIRDPTFGNAPPTADAGIDQNANEGAPVALSGSGADLEEMPITYAWVQIAGPMVTLSDAGAANPVFSAPLIASTSTASVTLSFRLTVTDDVGQTAMDTMTVTVNNGPNADAGSDATATEGASVSLDGSASNDPVAGAITYLWTQTAGTTVVLTGATSAAPTFTAPNVSTVGGTDTLSFQLSVTDADGLTASDTVTLSINDIAVGNAPPTAGAGTDQRLNEGANAMLAGAGTDPESGPVTLQWVQTGGSSVVLSDASSASPTFVAPLIASSSAPSELLTFQLTVTDNVSRTATDTVQITVNNGPNADAGTDQAVVESTTVILNGAGSNDPGGAITYAWVRLSGPSVTLSGATTATPSFTAPTEAFDSSDVLRFQVTVQDADGLTAVDTVDVTVNDIAVGNGAPTAIAGADQRVNEGASVALPGSGTDPESGALTFSWVQTAGSAVTLSNAATATPTFSAPSIVSTSTASAGLTFELTVTDSVGRTSTDTVAVTVNNGPNADAGPDQTVTESTSVSLTAAASDDPGAGALGYAWLQTTGPTVTLTGANTASPGFVAPAVAALGDSAALTFMLTVTDADGLSSTSTVALTVNDIAVGNAPPTVNAGLDQQANEGSAVALGAIGADPEGGPLSYSWTQTGGTTVALSNAAVAAPSFTAPIISDAGTPNITLSFSVTVTDNVGRSATDSVQVLINNAPTAAAGSDISVTESTAVALDGGASADAGGGAITYAWTQTVGTAVTLSGSNSATPSFVAPTLGFNVTDVLIFQLAVTDANGATAVALVQVTVNDIAVDNADPTANAGTDRQVNEGAAVNLAGTGSDPENASLAFVWIQTGGAAVTLVNANTAMPSFAAPVLTDTSVGSVLLTFQLTVTDDVGRNHSDSVAVNVNNGPDANAGSNFAVFEGIVATLAGGASADAGGSGPLTFNWTQIGGTAVTLASATSAAPTFTTPAQPFNASSVLRFQLVVTDAGGLTSVATVDVTVNDIAVGNLPPVVSAGADIAANEGALVALNGSASDPESGALTYSWVQLSGAPLALSNPTLPNPTFSAPLIVDQSSANVSHTFELTVTDNVGRSSTDQVIVSVNNGPLADAGADAIAIENTAVSLNGSTSADAGGSGPLSYAWTQTAGPAVLLSAANTATPSFTAPSITTVGGSDAVTFSLTVIDAGGLADTDTVIVQIDDIAVGNAAPSASAGTDQKVNESALGSLSGSASDPENGTLTYAWVQTSGTPVTLSDASSPTPTFTAPALADGVPGDALTFQLTVTDDVLRTATDLVQVVVNNAPTADAGADFAAGEETDVSLDGRNSNDPDGSIVSFTWIQTGGPAVALTGANTNHPTFTAPNVAPGGVALTFQLTVLDDSSTGALSATDSVTVQITNINSPPIANAGVDVAFNENTLVTLDASASSDPDGSAVTYLWVQSSGPPVTLSDAAAVEPGFTTPEVGPAGDQMTFLLTVTDVDGETSTAQVSVWIYNVNRAPVTDAGPNQTVAESATVTLSGSNSTDDDGALTYAWQQTGGAAVPLSDAANVAPTFTAPAVATSGAALTFTLRVTDQEGVASEDTVIVNVSDQNTPPVASAGADATVAESALVVLDGSNSSDADAPLGSIVAYVWTQISGTPVTLTNADTAQARLRAPLVTPAGTSVSFQLLVTDDAGAMSSDTVVINISNVNQPPTANAGADRTVREETTVILDGSNSFDVDAPVASYRWTQTAGAPLTLSDPTSDQPQFVAPQVRVNTPFTFELQVTDAEGLVATDTVTINVQDVGGVPPTADAGADQTVTEGSNVLLDASASTDRDGSITQFRWRQTSGNTATLSDVNIAAPSFTAPLVSSSGGALVFEVTVTDNDRLTATDTVIVNIGNVASAPVANAGADQGVNEGSTVTLNGTGSNDTAGNIVDYLWTQVAGPAVTLSSPAIASPTFVTPAITAAQTGAQVTLQLTVTDDDGLMATDSVVVTISDNGITGFPDAVLTLRTTSNDTVGVQPLTGNLVMLQAVNPTSIADQRNRPTRFDFDLINTTVRVPTAGATVEVVYYLDTAAPAGATWIKYSPTQGWTDYGSNARFSADRKQVTVTLTDGGRGDDDGLANGIIVDPSGLGSFARDTGTPGADNGGFAKQDAGGGGRFGCSLSPGSTGDPRDSGGIDATLLILLGLGLMHLVRARALEQKRRQLRVPAGDSAQATAQRAA